MAYDVKVETLKAHPLVVVRRSAALNELPQVIPQACGEVWNAVKSLGLQGGRLVAVYKTIADGAFDMEIGAEVAGPVPENELVHHSETPAGLAAIATHFGPYDQLGEAHRAIREWCEQHNKPLAGPAWEVYAHWDPAWNTDSAKIRTDIFYLLGSRV